MPPQARRGRPKKEGPPIKKGSAACLPAGWTLVSDAARAGQLPPGWITISRCTKAGFTYKRYLGPNGVMMQSKKLAWEAQDAASSSTPSKSPRSPRTSKTPKTPKSSGSRISRAAKTPKGSGGRKLPPPLAPLMQPIITWLDGETRTAVITVCDFSRTFLTEALLACGVAPPSVSQLCCGLQSPAQNGTPLIAALHITLLQVLLKKDNIAITDPRQTGTSDGLATHRASPLEGGEAGSREGMEIEGANSDLPPRKPRRGRKPKRIESVDDDGRIDDDAILSLEYEPGVASPFVLMLQDLVPLIDEDSWPEVCRQAILHWRGERTRLDRDIDADAALDALSQALAASEYGEMPASTKAAGLCALCERALRCESLPTTPDKVLQRMQEEEALLTSLRSALRRAKSVQQAEAKRALAALPSTATARVVAIAKDVGKEEVRRLSADLASAELALSRRESGDAPDGASFDAIRRVKLGRDRDDTVYWCMPRVEPHEPRGQLGQSRENPQELELWAERRDLGWSVVCDVAALQTALMKSKNAADVALLAELQKRIFRGASIPTVADVPRHLPISEKSFDGNGDASEKLTSAEAVDQTVRSRLLGKLRQLEMALRAGYLETEPFDSVLDPPTASMDHTDEKCCDHAPLDDAPCTPLGKTSEALRRALLKFVIQRALTVTDSSSVGLERVMHWRSRLVWRLNRCRSAAQLGLCLNELEAVLRESADLKPGATVQVNGANDGGKPRWHNSKVAAVWPDGSFRVQVGDDSEWLEDFAPPSSSEGRRQNGRDWRRPPLERSGLRRECTAYPV